MRRRENEDSEIFEQQLFEAKQALFSAKSVKQIKFLQRKIEYLRQKMRSKA